MLRHVFGESRRSAGGRRLRAAAMLALVALALTVTAWPAKAASGPLAFDFGSTYKVSPTAPVGWEQPAFDDSGWSTLAAPFSHGEATVCPGTFPAAAGDFPVGGTLFLRKSFTLPSNAFGLRLRGSVDNDADIWVNGAAQGGHVDSGFCQTNAINVQVANASLNHGASNVVAVKAVDEGVASFFDMQAAYGTIAFDQQPTETLKLSTLSPVTVKITDADGGAVSGANVQITLETVSGGGTLTGTTSAITGGTGIAQFSALAVTAPGKYRLVATSEGASVKSADFAVDDLTFAQQPTEAQKAVAITPAPTVTIKDPSGQGIAGKTVQVTLQTISGTGALTGGSTTSAVTDGNGVATFSNLAVTAPGTYRLVAASDNATATSNGFLIADQVTPCTGSCSAQGTSTGTTVKASTSTNGGSLAVSVVAGTTAPPGVCKGFTPIGAGSYVNLIGSSGDLTVTWTLDRTLVRQAGNPPALSFDICLGAEDLTHPNGTGATPWLSKLFKPAVPVADTDLGVTLFWGLLQNCLLVKWSHGKPTSPCWIDKRKNLRGDVIIDFFKPTPWDGRMYGG